MFDILSLFIFFIPFLLITFGGKPGKFLECIGITLKDASMKHTEARFI